MGQNVHSSWTTRALPKPVDWIRFKWTRSGSPPWMNTAICCSEKQMHTAPGYFPPPRIQDVTKTKRSKLFFLRKRDFFFVVVVRINCICICILTSKKHQRNTILWYWTLKVMYMKMNPIIIIIFLKTDDKIQIRLSQFLSFASLKFFFVLLKVANFPLVNS